MAELSIPRYDEIVRFNLPNYVSDKDTWVRQVVIGKDQQTVKPVVHIFPAYNLNTVETTLQRVDEGDYIYRNTFTPDGVSYSVHRVVKQNTGQLVVMRDKLTSYSLHTNPVLNPLLIEFLAPTSEDGQRNGLLPDTQGWVNGITTTMARRKVGYTSLFTGFNLNQTDLDLLLEAVIHSPSAATPNKWFEATPLPINDDWFRPARSITNSYEFWMFVYNDATGSHIKYDHDEIIAENYHEDVLVQLDRQCIRAIRCIVNKPVNNEKASVRHWELFTV